MEKNYSDVKKKKYHKQLSNQQQKYSHKGFRTQRNND